MSKPTKKKRPATEVAHDRRVKQRATVILEDTDDGRMMMRVEYDPEISAVDPITSCSVRASLGIIKYLANNYKK